VPINAGKIVEVGLVRNAAMAHENLAVDDCGQWQPAEYVAIQSYQFGGVVLCNKHYIDTVHDNYAYNKINKIVVINNK